MRVGIMITDGGPHPADKWASTTAEQIGDLIEIDAKSTSPEAIAARKAKPRFILDLADALEKHHQAHIDHAKSQLAALGIAFANPTIHSINAPHQGILDAAMSDVTSVANNTPFAAHFNDPNVQKVVRGIVGSHFTSSMHIEKSWAVDRHIASGAASEHTHAFKNFFHQPPVDVPAAPAPAVAPTQG
jgi:hypothetical protein